LLALLVLHLGVPKGHVADAALLAQLDEAVAGRDAVERQLLGGRGAGRDQQGRADRDMIHGLLPVRR
jgi:hypothetical protein